MLTNLSHTQVWVLDQDVAIDFYVGKLGLVVGVDAQMEVMRWLTVSLPGTTEPEIALLQPGPPALDPQTAQLVRELVTRGGMPTLFFGTDDCQATYDELVGRGVEFTEQPTTRFYGTDCALRDPFGNSIRIGQRAEGEIEVPLAQQSRTAR
jgi:catechol 2,3-dioxygenase-like lactoylglutathione lyase family enzyme